MISMKIQQILPADPAKAILIGRIWDPVSQGPRVVSVRGEDVFDLSPGVRTVAELMEYENPWKWFFKELTLRVGTSRRSWKLRRGRTVTGPTCWRPSTFRWSRPAG
jgi:fumarylacetoacetate (FAA) hydrolase family protein